MSGEKSLSCFWRGDSEEEEEKNHAAMEVCRMGR